MSAALEPVKKQPYAVIDIPLKKFVEDALPFHKKIFEVHKSNMMKVRIFPSYLEHYLLIYIFLVDAKQKYYTTEKGNPREEECC